MPCVLAWVPESVSGQVYEPGQLGSLLLTSVAVSMDVVLGKLDLIDLVGHSLNVVLFSLRLLLNTWVIPFYVIPTLQFLLVFFVVADIHNYWERSVLGRSTSQST